MHLRLQLHNDIFLVLLVRVTSYFLCTEYTLFGWWGDYRLPLITNQYRQCFFIKYFQYVIMHYMLHFRRSSFCLNIFCDSKPHVMDGSLPLLCVLCLSPVSPHTWLSVSSHWHSVSRHLAQCLLTLTVLVRVKQLMRRERAETMNKRKQMHLKMF